MDKVHRFLMGLAILPFVSPDEKAVIVDNVPPAQYCAVP